MWMRIALAICSSCSCRTFLKVVISDDTEGFCGTCYEVRLSLPQLSTEQAVQYMNKKENQPEVRDARQLVNLQPPHARELFPDIVAGADEVGYEVLVRFNMYSPKEFLGM